LHAFLQLRLFARVGGTPRTYERQRTDHAQRERASHGLTS
jgi:hypothetical protein